MNTKKRHKGNARSKKKSQAYDLYMDTDFTQEEIAEVVGVVPHTIGKWKKEGKWDELKTLHTVSNQRLIKDTISMIHNLDEEIKGDTGIPTGKQANIRRQLVKDLQELETETGILDYINGVGEFILYIKENHDPELALVILRPLFKSFLANKAKNL